MKKLILTITLFTGLFGCGTCPEYKGFYFDINGIEIINMERRTSNGRFRADPESTLSFENHSFALLYKATYYSHKEANNINLLSSAMATSCKNNGEGGSKEYIDTIIVTTNYDIDDQHKKGDIINDIVRYEGKILDSFLASDSIEIPNQNVFLELTKKPELDNSLSVDILVKLLNGEEYRATSERVFLK